MINAVATELSTHTGKSRDWKRARGCSFVACLSHLTIDHASLSRRSTGPTPNRHLQHWAPITLLAYITFFLNHIRFPLRVSTFMVSPRIVTVFSPLSGVLNSSMTFAYFPHLQHIPFLVVHFTICHKVSSTLLLWHNGTSAHLLPPLEYW